MQSAAVGNVIYCHIIHCVQVQIGTWSAKEMAPKGGLLYILWVSPC